MAYIDAYDKYMHQFDAEAATEYTVNWIREWFEKNGARCNAVIGISGGKDSTVVAGLCVKALGADRVIGVLMPNGEQWDIDDSFEVCEVLGIEHYVHDINSAYTPIIAGVAKNLGYTTEQTTINVAPRIRMTTLYAYSQSKNGRVANTCNLSEDYVGYSTKFGDAAGDFAPLKNFTSDEVIAIGKVLGLPTHLLDKTPADGLCGKTDEDNLGFTYRSLNSYLRTGYASEKDIEIIERKHSANLFKERVIDRPSERRFVRVE